MVRFIESNGIKYIFYNQLPKKVIDFHVFTPAEFLSKKEKFKVNIKNNLWMGTQKMHHELVKKKRTV